MNPFTKLNTLFLDAGNTILFMDFEFLSHELEVLGARVAPVKLARAEAAARPFVSKHVAHNASTEASDTRQVYVSKLLEVAGIEESGISTEEISPQLLLRFMNPEFRNLLWSHVPAGIPQALEALRSAGYGLTVVSNSDGSVFAMLERAGLTQFLDHVIDSGCVGVEKPDPAIFEIALERSKTSRERALHTGDLYHVDVIGAQRAGLKAVLLDPYGDWEDCVCHKAQSVTELSRQILEIND